MSAGRDITRISMMRGFIYHQFILSPDCVVHRYICRISLEEQEDVGIFRDDGPARNPRGYWRARKNAGFSSGSAAGPWPGVGGAPGMATSASENAVPSLGDPVRSALGIGCGAGRQRWPYVLRCGIAAGLFCGPGRHWRRVPEFPSVARIIQNIWRNRLFLSQRSGILPKTSMTLRWADDRFRPDLPTGSNSRDEGPISSQSRVKEQKMELQSGLETVPLGER